LDFQACENTSAIPNWQGVSSIQLFNSIRMKPPQNIRPQNLAGLKNKKGKGGAEAFALF
jgi:hypothetical protein